MTCIIDRREIQEFFTEGAEKTLCFSVSISFGCSLCPPDHEQFEPFGEERVGPVDACERADLDWVTSDECRADERVLGRRLEQFLDDLAGAPSRRALHVELRGELTQLLDRL